MSGICGIIAFNPSAPVDGIDAMIGAAPWRGPDGVGVRRGEGAVLAHQALHVTPESRHEEQPLVDEEAGLVLVADARIDNREELQRTLRRDLRRSVRHDVITDADLILAAYRRWGPDCAAHLIGDFAFAVWDSRKRQLFAARDPMAMRPFYYRIEEGRVLFGSEVKQILAAPGVPRTIFEPMVAMHLCGRFDRLDWTFYEGIAQLEPAHALVVTPDGAHRTWRYWDIDPTHQIRYTNEQDYVEHFRELFKEAVRCRLRSHKPVGLFLSGGLDSGSIASMAGHIKETEGLPCPEFRTYSWKFPTLTQCDERHISDLICDRYDLPATYIDAEAVNLIGPPDGVPDADEPFMSHYQALISAGLQKAHGDGVRLLLTGARGDSVIGSKIVDNLGLLFSGKLLRLAREIETQSAEWGGESGVSRRRIVSRTLLHPLLRSARHLVRSEPEKREQAIPSWVNARVKYLLPSLGTESSQGQPLARSYAQKVRRSNITAEQPRRVMSWFERLGASHGCDVGDCWTDQRLVEFCSSVPQFELLPGGRNKGFLKKAVVGIMPQAVLNEARKVYPSPLYHLALKDDTVLAKLRYHTAEVPQYILDTRALISEIKSFRNGKPEDYRLWLGITFLLWLGRVN